MIKITFRKYETKMCIYEYELRKNYIAHEGKKRFTNVERTHKFLNRRISIKINISLNKIILSFQMSTGIS